MINVSGAPFKSKEPGCSLEDSNTTKSLLKLIALIKTLADRGAKLAADFIPEVAEG